MDRENTCSWRGDTLLANMNEVEHWTKGRKIAIEYLRQSNLFTDVDIDFEGIARDEEEVDILRPYREQVKVQAGHQTTYTLTNLDEQENEDPYRRSDNTDA